MVSQKDAPGPGVGWFPRTETCLVWNRTGSATVVGEVVQFNFGLAGSETTDIENDGGDDSAFANVIAATGATGAMYAVCTEIAADNALMTVVTKGYVSTLLVDGDPGVNGECYVPASGNPTDAQSAGVSNEKVIAISLESDTASVAAIFDGINGFGSFGETDTDT